jgi:hypothetical protein
MTRDDDKQRRFDAATLDLKSALGRIAAEHGNGLMFAATLRLLAEKAIEAGESRKVFLDIAARAYAEAKRSGAEKGREP